MFLTFVGPCILNIFQYISNKMQLYTVYLYLETALHVSGGTSTHHQESIQLYLQHLVFVTTCYLPLQRQIPNVINTVVCDPDDEWRYHPKYEEQFPDINELYKVASCWIYIYIYIYIYQNIKLCYLRRFSINISRESLQTARNAAGDFVPCIFKNTPSLDRLRQISLHSLNFRMAVGEV